MSTSEATDREVLNLERLRKQVRASWGTPTPDAIASAASASVELSQLAYRDGDHAAREQAESLIYFLNLDSCFAPPMEPVTAVVWSTLMQEKLASLRREFVGEPADAGELSAEQMRDELKALVAKWGAYNHPLVEDLEETGDIEAYRIWAKNWFGSCYGFSLQLASLVQRTTGETKKTVLENLNDEFDESVTHDTLRIRFYESLGLRHAPEEAPADPDWVLESTELLNLRTGLCNLSQPRWALGAFYTIEANWPPECRRHRAMNKQRGLDDHTVEYWTTHAFADEHHSSEWLEVVDGLCETGAERGKVVEGATIQLRLRWRMYDSIRRRVQASR